MARLPLLLRSRAEGGLWVTPSSCFSQFFELAPPVVIGQFPWAMENRQATVRVEMDVHLCPNIMATILIRRNLERQPLKTDTVIRRDRPLMVFTQNVF